jgi:hypothetical protein
LTEYEQESLHGGLLAKSLHTQKPADLSSRETELAQALLETDLDSLSPVEALMKLYELRKLAEPDKPHGIKKTA